jgi:hypothetical protein
MNKILKYTGLFIGLIVIFLIIMQLLDSMGVNTCIYDCEEKPSTYGKVNNYFNGKLIK